MNGIDKHVSIVVDGVVGVGKSTLMHILEKQRGFSSFPEPVVDNPILDKFYYDRKRYAFPLQILFLNHRFDHIKKASKMQRVVMDRSIYTDIVFAKQLMEGGDMTRAEYDIYYDLLHNMLDHCQPPTLMIYLDISTENAVKRIQKRGRNFEQEVELGYWQELNKNYQNYFANYQHSALLKIDVNDLDFENNLDHREFVLKRIDDAIEKILACKQNFAIIK